MTSQTDVITPQKKLGPLLHPRGITMTGVAWVKILKALSEETEIGFFGVIDEKHPLHILDLYVPKQEATEGSVEFNDLDLLMYRGRMAESGHTQQECLGIWIHTHPSNSARPSTVDETTFDELMGPDESWLVMMIVAKDASTTQRLRANCRPFRIDTPLTFDAVLGVDWGCMPYKEEMEAFDTELITKVDYPTVYGLVEDPYGIGRQTPALGCAGSKVGQQAMSTISTGYCHTYDSACVCAACCRVRARLEEAKRGNTRGGKGKNKRGHRGGKGRSKRGKKDRIGPNNEHIVYGDIPPKEDKPVKATNLLTTNEAPTIGEGITSVLHLVLHEGSTPGITQDLKQNNIDACDMAYQLWCMDHLDLKDDDTEGQQMRSTTIEAYNPLTAETMYLLDDMVAVIEEHEDKQSRGPIGYDLP